MSNQPEISERPERIWNKFFVSNFAVNVFVCTGLFMINSIIAKYIFSIYDNVTFTGLINAAFSILAIIGRIVAGDISDRRGRIKVMLFGAGIFAVSVFCFGVFPYAAILIIFRALQGFGFGATNTANNAVSADVLPENRMSEGIGYMGLSFSLASAVGAAIAISLIFDDDYSLVFYVTTGMIVISMIITLFLRYEKLPFYQNKMREQKQRSKAVELSEYTGLRRLIEYKALPSAFVQLLNSTSFAAVNFYILIYADSIGLTGAATFYTVMAIGMSVTRLFIGRLAEKFGDVPVGGVSLFMQIVGMLFLIYVSGIFTFCAAGFLVGAGFSSITPILQTAAIKRSPVNRKGAASGTYQISNDIAQGGGALLWGSIIDHMGFRAAFVGCIIFCALSIVMLWVFFGKNRSRESGQSQP